MVEVSDKVKELLSKQLYADFETTTKVNYDKEGMVRVYMWGLKDGQGGYWTGTGLGEFMDRVRNIAKGRSINIWFHNLKFDFSFIEWWLLSYNLAHFKKKEVINRWTTFGKEYTTTRDGMNLLYSAEWYVNKKTVIKFMDSAKLYPMPLSSLGELVGVKKLQEQFDYHKYIPTGYWPDDEEWEYLDHDVEIVKRIVETQIKRAGVVRMTRTGYAFNGLRDMYIAERTPDDWDERKKTLRHPDGKKFKKKDSIFEYHFPKTSPSLYDELKPSYAGGSTQLMPQHKGNELGKTITYDVNSEYPGVMLNNWYPIFKEERFDGNYLDLGKEIKKERPLFVQRFTAKFKIKKNGFPSIPKKMGDKERTIYSHKDLLGRGILMLTNIDMKHFFKNFDVEEITFLGGFHWEAIYAPFKPYIDKLSKEKIAAELRGDPIMRQITKLEMNGCYGKFAQNPYRTSKDSRLDDEEVVRFDTNEDDPEEQQYFPMGIFITAYARNTLFNGIYKAGMDRFVYCDTDSIHLLGHEPVEGLDIHPTRLGAWKWEEEKGGFINGKKTENKIVNAKYLREKCYAHLHELPLDYDDNKQPVLDEETGLANYLDIKAAGLAEKAKATVKDIAEFNLGQSYSGSMTQFLKKGGTLLTDTSKLLKEEAFKAGELAFLEMIGEQKEDPTPLEV